MGTEVVLVFDFPDHKALNHQVPDLTVTTIEEKLEKIWQDKQKKRPVNNC
jgi:hypothetical protein